MIFESIKNHSPDFTVREPRINSFFPASFVLNKNSIDKLGKV